MFRVEDDQEVANKKDSVPVGIDETFYFEIMEKLRNFTKETENKDKEINELKSELGKINY